MGVRRRVTNGVVAAAVAAAAAPRGTAPAIDPRHEYYLLSPGYGIGYDRVNPGRKLPRGCCSYALQVGVHKVRVLLKKKKCYEICNSPPATAQCKRSIKQDGKLTVGWLGDIKHAWHIVLGVVGIGEDCRPLSETQDGQPAPETQRATAARNECDARATAARTECDATTEDHEHESDLPTQMINLDEKPTHHMNEPLPKAVSTLEFDGSGSASSTTAGATGARPPPVLPGSIGEFEFLVRTPTPAYGRLVPSARTRRQRSSVRIPKTRTWTGSFWMRLPKMWVRTAAFTSYAVRKVVFAV